MIFNLIANILLLAVMAMIGVLFLLAWRCS
jgi:hypothetical protein